MQKMNLTGVARHVRDLAADVHANVQQWNKFHLEGVNILKAIAQESHDETYSHTLQELCDKLEAVCDSLDDVVRNLSQIAKQMRATTCINESTDVLFTTWPTLLFGQRIQDICDAYANEARAKRKILEDVAHGRVEPWKMLHLIGWVHQPTLNDSTGVALESVLTETGHR